VKSSPTKPTNTGATTHGNSGASTQTTHGKSASHGPATKPTGSGTVTHGKSGETHGGSTKHADTSSTTTKKTSSSTTSSTSTTSGTGSTTTLTPLQQKLLKNTNLADKLRTRLPAGTDLMKAAEGFTSLGKFVSAVNVSYNHEGVKFTDLKTRMLDEGMSLGQALQDVKKTADVTAEVKKAETEADAMIKSSTTTTTTSTTTTPTSTKKTKTKSTGDK
jgi:hypothetical protein